MLGRWEGDLLAGSGNMHIATLVEGRSRFTIMVRGAPAPGLQAAEAVALDDDVGPRARDCLAPGLRSGDEREGVLLRRSEPVAVRDEREHEPPAASVRPEGYTPVDAYTGAPGPDHAQAQWQAAADVQI